MDPLSYSLVVFRCVFQMNKPVSKQEDTWMNPFVKQFNNMNFSVSVAHTNTSVLEYTRVEKTGVDVFVCFLFSSAERLP